jgi:hypothetical protein
MIADRSFPRKNFTPADVILADSKPGKPARESGPLLPSKEELDSGLRCAWPE